MDRSRYSGNGVDWPCATYFETGVLVIASMILGTLLMVFCAALCKSAHDGDLLSETKKAAKKSNFDLDGKGKLGAENEDDCDL